MGILSLWFLPFSALVSMTFGSELANATTSANIGDYVAFGMELEKVKTDTASSKSDNSSTTTSTVTSTAPLLSTSGTGPPSTPHTNNTLRGGNTVTISSTSYITSCRPSSTDSRGQLWSDCDFNDTIVTKTCTNTSWAPATNVGECWTDWISYWSMHPPSPAVWSAITVSLSETTITTAYEETFGTDITDQIVTSTITSTAPTIADNGGFITTTPLVVVTYTTVITSFFSATSISTSLFTYTNTPRKYEYTTISAFDDPDWPRPSCTLPATKHCNPHLMNNPWLGQIVIGTVAMNMTDLMHEPVPYSIYASQPYCASQIFTSACVAGTADDCPTTLPYRPLIVLSSQLLNTLNPAWASCSLDLRGLYDPPIALQPATAIVVPTMAGPSPTTSATPAYPPVGATQSPTALPEQDNPTPSQAPDSSPEPTSPSAEALKPSPNDSPPVAGQSSEDSPTPTSSSAEVSEMTPNGPPPETSHGTSADPAGAIISLIGEQAANNNPTTISIGSQLITATPGKPLVVAGTTSLSKAPVVVDGHTLISSGSDGLIVDRTSVIALPSGRSQAPAAVFTVGSQTLTALAADAASASAIVLAGNTLSRGGPAATIGGAVVSVGAAGLVIDGSRTVQLPQDGASLATAAASQAILTVGSSTITAILAGGSENTVVIDGTTLSRGSSAITVDGRQVSFGTAGLVVDGSQTIPVSKFEPVPTAVAALQAVLTIGGSTITAMAASGTDAAIVIDGTTLSPGGSAITVDGTQLSAGPSDIVIDGTQTISLSSVGSKPTPTDALQTVLTLGDGTITAFLPFRSGEAIIANGTTLSPGGPAITVDGTKLSAGTAGLIVGGTRTVSPEMTTESSGVTEGASTSAFDTPTATSPGSTSDSTQSGGRRAFLAQGEWLFVLIFGVCTLLGVVWG